MNTITIYGKDNQEVPAPVYFEASEYVVINLVVYGFNDTAMLTDTYTVAHAPSGLYTGTRFPSIDSAANFARWMHEQFPCPGSNLQGYGALVTARKQEIRDAIASFGGEYLEDGL